MLDEEQEQFLRELVGPVSKFFEVNTKFWIWSFALNLWYSLPFHFLYIYVSAVCSPDRKSVV